MKPDNFEDYLRMIIESEEEAAEEAAEEEDPLDDFYDDDENFEFYGSEEGKRTKSGKANLKIHGAALKSGEVSDVIIRHLEAHMLEFRALKKAHAELLAELEPALDRMSRIGAFGIESQAAAKRYSKDLPANFPQQFTVPSASGQSYLQAIRDRRIRKKKTPPASDTGETT